MQKLKANVWKLLRALSPGWERHLKERFSRSCADNWGYRTRKVMACPDNRYIPRAAHAGEIIDGFQIMHNGLKVTCGSYYGDGPITLLRRNRGVHEPQEERVFQEVLKVIPRGGVMIELGAYWSFYSLWFRQAVLDSRTFMVEPVAENLAYGRSNFSANSFQGEFFHAYVGARSATAEDGTKVICVDDFVRENRIEHVAILHSDIQGFELEMLQGSERTLREGRVSWFFVSTHSEELHQACEKFLVHRGFVTVASIPPGESFSTDGILVARAPYAPALPPLKISRRKRSLI